MNCELSFVTWLGRVSFAAATVSLYMAAATESQGLGADPDPPSKDAGRCTRVAPELRFGTSEVCSQNHWRLALCQGWKTAHSRQSQNWAEESA
jgi:hypothetical protein